MPPPPTSLQPTRHCNREMSSIARRLIHQAWMPVVTQFQPGLRLPHQCPLHPWRDVQGKAELAKLHYRVNLWTCAECGKSFNGEAELENHIHARHPSLSTPGDFSVCLADFCDIMRCSLQRVASRRPWPTRQPYQAESVQLAKAPSRELVALLENTDAGLSLDPVDISHSCTSSYCVGVPGSPRLRRQMARIAQNESEDCPECSARRSQCDSDKMADLQIKCQMLVNTCVAPLALHLSDKELEDLKEKLEAQVCWYLTCDRYWSVQGGKRHPNILAILLVILTTAVIFLTFAYYVVWVCF
eukprot:TRINITY_DN23819_c1_g1_i1.p1 TRINITY_DN23819_c1_g1~~TRINITY_DN23819_c1_g1_i1.p1  ORF type:complete len:307 (+),score=93.33 TRINITY_DN23819_c1_g1_i1:24-923(+)